MGTAIVAVALAFSGCNGEWNGADSSAAPTYALSATVSGLTSSGLVLTVNGAAVNVAANTTTQPLASSLAAGSHYSVTVAAQPAGETCTVAGGTGTIVSANVANVVITCAEQAYSLGGLIRGLNGSGLVLANGSDTLNIATASTSFTLPTTVTVGSSYTITVQTQPQGLACAVSNGTGTMPASDVTNVAISCTDQPFVLGGTISGLGNRTGLILANGSDTLIVAAGSTSFTMPRPIPFATPYAIVVRSAPPGFTCSVSNASGTMPASNVTSIAIACSSRSYSVGGTISGLTSGGLVLANGSDTLTVRPAASGFTLPTPVAYGSTYAVTVQTQPSGQTCSVSNGSGSMDSGNVTNIAVTCSTNTYTVGGTLSGLNASGLVLLNNGADATPISANATQFTMNTGVAYASPYAITVQTQPAGLVCRVTDGSGTVGAANVTSVSIACASNTTILYSFAGGSDGAQPYHSLIQANDGNFYGTTQAGGTSNGGTIFKITPNGTESVFYSFPGSSSPFSGVIQASDGNFYGTTGNGGISNQGTVFKITPGGTETVLYAFAGGSSDGKNPYTGVIQGSDGNFYGTTYFGGSSSVGTIFKVTPSGTETVLYSFAKDGKDGYYPYAGLIQGSDGNFYGTTYFGGSSGLGTVFMISPSGIETVLYSFAGGSDGANPYGSVTQGSDGNFYGTTYQGGSSGYGTVFKITPTGTETTLYSFTGSGGDGAYPEAGLTLGQNGNFYGATYQGGSSGLGTVFEITPGGTETVLHSFAGGSDDGAEDWTNLVQGSDGNLYGTTYAGGSGSSGTFFKVTLH